MNRPSEGWQRLASYVVSARIDAGFKEQRALAAATGISERTLGKLENGQPVGATTLVTVARRLGWTPDSPQRILNGGDPVPLPAPVAPPEPEHAGRTDWIPILQADEAEIGPWEAQVWKEIALAPRGRDSAGAEIFARDFEIATWDTPQLRTPEEKVRLIAKLRMFIETSGQSRATG